MTKPLHSSSAIDRVCIEPAGKCMQGCVEQAGLADALLRDRAVDVDAPVQATVYIMRTLKGACINYMS